MNTATDDPKHHHEPSADPGPLLADREPGFEEALADAESLAERRSFVTAFKRFAEVRRAIEQHVEVEEKVWLPRILNHWPERGLRLLKVVHEHQALCHTVNEISEALTAWNAPKARAELARLRTLLAAHRVRENTEIYPAAIALHATEPHH